MLKSASKVLFLSVLSGLLIITVNSAFGFKIPQDMNTQALSTITVTADTGAAHHGVNVTFGTPSSRCAVCHQKEFHEWRYAAGSDLDTVGIGTSHSMSTTDGMYTQMLESFDVSVQAQCKGCHQSGNAWAVQDKVNDSPKPRDINVAEGTNCVVCHYNGTEMVAASALSDPVFCATCHNDKEGVTDVYKDWISDYTGGKTCNQCHMIKDSHIFVGINSDSFLKKTIKITKFNLPETVTANAPFEISFNLMNVGAGHSVPADLLRKLRARVSIDDGAGNEVFSWEKSYYKRHAIFGEDPTNTEVIKAGKIKTLNCQGIVKAPGVYTVKVEVLQDKNRAGIKNSTTLMEASYQSIFVH